MIGPCNSAFGILEMHPRIRKQMMIPRVVVMHVSDDDIRHLRVRYADRPQAFVHRTYQGRPRCFACSASNPVSTTMVLLRSHDRPDEVVQGHGPVVESPPRKLCVAVRSRCA